MQKFQVKIIILVLFFAVVPMSQAEQCQTRSDSAKIYISDSHIGMGGKCNGTECRDGWHNMEDFRWHEDFKLFLNYLENLSGSIDLIMVGDVFELWQDMAGIPCEDDAQGSDLGCNAKQAKLRIQEVGKKHKELFLILSDFIRTDKKNKIIMLPGNHDAALAMNSVAATTKELFTADTRKNICVDEDGMIFSNGIFVEHGHQIEGDLNRYSKPLNGTIECINRDGDPVNCNDSNAFVRRSWGENFVQNYYNDYENKFPVIDNYSAEGSGMPDGVKRGLRASSFPEKSSAALGFVSFLFTKHTWDHYKGVLGDKRSVTTVCRNNNQSPCLDIDSMKNLSATDAIFTQLPQGEGELLQLIFTVPEMDTPKLKDVYAYYSAINEDALSVIDEMLITTCIYWDQAANKEKEVNCSYKNRSLGVTGSRVQQWFKSILDRNYEKITDHIEQREKQFDKKIKFFIYGHTHLAEQRDTADGSKKILNTGAWQRVASAKRIGEIIDRCAASGPGRNKDDCFQEMTPNSLPSCYSFVVSNSEELYKDPTLYWWTRKEPNTEFIYKDKPPYCK